MAVPSALVLKCASCGEEGPHRVLQGRVGGRRGRTFHGTVKCTHCGTVSSATYREPRTVSVDLLVSWMDKTEHHTLDLDETRAVAVGEQFPAEGGTVEVTSLEVGGRRRGRGLAGEITTIWAKRADEVRVKAAILRGPKTHFKDIFAAPDEEFEVGEILEVGRERVVVWRIQLEGRLLTEGVASAERIVRLLCRPVRETTRY